MTEGKINPGVLLPHEAKQTLPCWHFQNLSNLQNRITANNSKVSISGKNTAGAVLLLGEHDWLNWSCDTSPNIKPST